MNVTLVYYLSMRKTYLFWVLLVVFLSAPFQLLAQADKTDIYEDASAYGYDIKQSQEDEIFFYESRFVDLGLHLGGRTFTGGLGQLFGTGFSAGAFLTYFFTRQFAGEFTVNDSFHQFLIDGRSGWATLLDILGRAKYYFISEGYSKALLFANPYLFVGGGLFIRTKWLNDVPAGTTDQGPGFDFGGGFEIPIKARQVFMGVQGSYQLIFFQDESSKTSRGTPLNGDAINFALTLTYSF